ncbi:MAG: LysR family transcriptional regulator [Pseudoalteromonas nigrifaciens]|uniref:LysR family transcriptional regulator n=1 Tax=Pseudoalteromonas nigrifaciens TaxID=28109 RepID=UPI003C784C4E
MANAHELTLFSLVVDAQSFNKAAEVAGISTPALSKKISRLEKDLGVQLLYRTTRKLSLTEAGSSLYQHAKSIELQLNDALNSVSAYRGAISGSIKMTVPTISGELLLAQVVGQFCEKYPNVNVDMRLENDFIDLVDKRIDLAIRTGVLADSSLIAKPIIKSRWVVCCAPNYIEKFGEPSNLDDLSRHNCLAYTYQNKGAREWRFTHQGEEVSIAIKGNFSANTAQALRQNALSGYGIVYVPRCCVYEHLLTGELVAILSEYQPRELGVYAVYPYTRHQPEKIKLLIEYITNAYSELSDYF